MTGFWTVVTGVAVFVLGQIVQRFILEPIHDYRRLLGEIATARVFLGNVGPVQSEPPEGLVVVGAAEPLEAVRNVRALAARLIAIPWTIPFYDLWSKFGVVLPRSTTVQAARALMSWSNSIFGGQPHAMSDKVATLLRLPKD